MLSKAPSVKNKKALQKLRFLDGKSILTNRTYRTYPESTLVFVSQSLYNLFSGGNVISDPGQKLRQSWDFSVHC